MARGSAPVFYLLGIILLCVALVKNAGQNDPHGKENPERNQASNTFSSHFLLLLEIISRSRETFSIKTDR
jgi:hypothetical protein